MNEVGQCSNVVTSEAKDAAGSALNGASARPTRELLIIGAGGFGAVAARTAESMNDHSTSGPWDVIGYADLDPAKRGTQHADRIVHGTIDEIARDFHNRGLWFFCAIGNNAARARMVRCAEDGGWRPATLVHPTAIVDSTVEIGAGSYIGPASVVSFKSRIGAHVVIDMHVSVGHDAVLMNFCEVFSGARVNGNCRVGEYALVGCNATLLPGTIVGDRAVVGANSVVHGSVEADSTTFGVPARTIRRRIDPLANQEPLQAAEEADYGDRDSA